MLSKAKCAAKKAIESTYDGVVTVEEFKKISDVIIANRCNDEIMDVLEKVYTRDLYFRD